MIGVYLSPMEKLNQNKIKSIRSVTERALEILLYRSEQHKFELCDWFIPLNKLSSYGRFETKSSERRRYLILAISLHRIPLQIVCSIRMQNPLYKAYKHKCLLIQPQELLLQQLRRLYLL